MSLATVYGRRVAGLPGGSGGELVGNGCVRTTMTWACAGVHSTTRSWGVKAVSALDLRSGYGWPSRTVEHVVLGLTFFVRDDLSKRTPDIYSQSGLHGGSRRVPL